MTPPPTAWSGDYIYEYKAGDYRAPGGNPRDHAGPETETLANYRQRHTQYKSDPDLQAAHAVAPWAVVWDDHKVDNNWANLVYENPHIRYFNNRRGYVRTRITVRQIRAYFRAVPRVSSPGAQAETKASFVIEDRRPGLQPV